MANDWTGLLPLLILAGGGTATFLVGAFWRRRPAGVLFALALVTAGTAAAATLLLPSLGPGLEDLLDLGGYFRFFTSVLMFITIITLLYVRQYSVTHGFAGDELYAFLIFAALGMVLVVAGTNWVIFYVAAIGGGALIDMAGFAAATAHRGLRLIRVPTTVMAQADAAIGVKNGINAFGKKNFIGTFAPPVAVLNDAGFLPTLSPRDWIGGVAEAVKVALIKDSDFLAFLEKHADALAHRNLDLMNQVIYRSAVLHLNHIAQGGDPFESGSSRPLDFGHWAAHKLEHLSGYALGHGQAVALGLALDSTYARLMGLLPPSRWQRILTNLRTLGFALYDPRMEADHSLLEGLREFQEHLGGRLTLMLLWGIGQRLEVHDLNPDLVRESLALLKKEAAVASGYTAPRRDACATNLPF